MFKVTYTCLEGHVSQAYVEDEPSVYGIYSGEDRHTEVPVLLEPTDGGWFELVTEEVTSSDVSVSRN